MKRKAAAGVSVRLLLGDPDSEVVAVRGVEEGIDEAMAAKSRNALVLYRPLLATPGVELRLHLHRDGQSELFATSTCRNGQQRHPSCTAGRTPRL